MKSDTTFKFQKYKAKESDLKTISETCSDLFNSDLLSDIFTDKDLIRDTSVISFDSEYLYIWNHEYSWNHKKFSHKVKINDRAHLGWRTGIFPSELFEYLPKKIQKYNYLAPKISGGLLNPFISRTKPPYNSKESYICTIIHEFAHIYYNAHIQGYHSRKDKNIEYMNSAIKLYKNENTKYKKEIIYPSKYDLGEIFAGCTEYSLVERKFPQVKKDYDTFAVKALNKAKSTEKQINYDVADSTLSDAHFASIVFSKILMTKYPKNWSAILLENKTVF